MLQSQSYVAYQRRKRKPLGQTLIAATVSTLLCAAAVIVILLAGYHAISRELCYRDNITAKDYAEMKLDCSQYRR